jgi:hypothetical protein
VKIGIEYPYLCKDRDLHGNVFVFPPQGSHETDQGDRGRRCFKQRMMPLKP